MGHKPGVKKISIPDGEMDEDVVDVLVKLSLPQDQYDVADVQGYYCQREVEEDF